MSDACSPTAAVGTILYNGPFNPQIDAEEHFSENFTVTIPSDIAKGPTQINFVRFFLFGVSPYNFSFTSKQLTMAQSFSLGICLPLEETM